MKITNRGKAWEFRNSLWIIWTFIPLLESTAFFWIGGRSGKRKWIWFGIAYLLTGFGTAYISGQFKNIDALYHILMVITCLSWLCAPIHAFLVRKEYLIRREAVLDLQDSTREAYRGEIRRDYFGNNIPPAQAGILQPQAQIPQPSAPLNYAPQAMPQLKLDLNTADESRLAALPGVGIALAKKAVEIRTQIGRFVSVGDFCNRLELMPHFAMQIPNFAYVAANTQQAISPQPAPQSNSGRVIDI
ncbi:MAG: helix-hairpin-helix domain-containing protein [Oscillospiraceae bacterium]|jgi:hypothetical protein|nr:helix-hairpin-helix domain-containing protein [Oscillospiraceae bacterium]